MAHTKTNVVVISDCKDVAFNEMRRVIVNECTKLDCPEVDIELVAVAEFSIINAAFLTRLISDYCSSNTILSVVINPQKHRSSRIFGETTNGLRFFGANTGALNWLLEDFGFKALYEINDPGFVPFGGKYVHAPNVAKLVAGIPFDNFGKPFPENALAKMKIKDGTVVHIDNFGLMKIKGETPQYEDGTKLNISVNSEYRLKATFSHRMMSLDDGEWVLYPGSSLNSMPELGTVRYADGFKEMNIKIGDIVKWDICD